MLHNLLIGTVIICATVIVHMFGLMLVTEIVSWRISGLREHGHKSRVMAMIAVVIGLFCIISVEVWIWAGCYFWLGFIGELETALYFSTITFSTIGYGDIVPSSTWRLLAGMEGVNGFIMIGWSTAYLVAAGTRVGPFRSGTHF